MIPAANVVEQTKISESAVNGDSSAVISGVAGRRWAIYELHLELDTSANVIFKSGGGQISGKIAAGTTPVYLENSPVPVLIAATTGTDFIVNTSTSADLSGWVVYSWLDRLGDSQLWDQAIWDESLWA